VGHYRTPGHLIKQTNYAKSYCIKAKHNHSECNIKTYFTIIRNGIYAITKYSDLWKNGSITRNVMQNCTGKSPGNILTQTPLSQIGKLDTKYALNCLKRWKHTVRQRLRRTHGCCTTLLQSGVDDPDVSSANSWTTKSGHGKRRSSNRNHDDVHEVIYQKVPSSSNDELQQKKIHALPARRSL